MHLVRRILAGGTMTGALAGKACSLRDDVRRCAVASAAATQPKEVANFTDRRAPLSTTYCMSEGGHAEGMWKG